MQTRLGDLNESHDTALLMQYNMSYRGYNSGRMPAYLTISRGLNSGGQKKSQLFQYELHCVYSDVNSCRYMQIGKQHSLINFRSLEIAQF